MSKANLPPRDRLLRYGPDAVTDAELLAGLLRNGSPGVSAVEVAQQLITATGGLHGLIETDRRSLRRCGARNGRAAIVLAAAEVIRRVAKRRVSVMDLLDNPAAVAFHVAVRHHSPEQEVLGTLYLNTRNRLIADRVIFRGTFDSARVEPRQVIAEALRLRAAKFPVFHTHPSGDPAPSQEDRDVNFRLGEAARLIGVKMTDHIIVGDAARWVSMRRRGW